MCKPLAFQAQERTLRVGRRKYRGSAEVCAIHTTADHTWCERSGENSRRKVQNVVTNSSANCVAQKSLDQDSEALQSILGRDVPGLSASLRDGEDDAPVTRQRRIAVVGRQHGWSARRPVSILHRARSLLLLVLLGRSGRAPGGGLSLFSCLLHRYARGSETGTTSAARRLLFGHGD